MKNRFISVSFILSFAVFSSCAQGVDKIDSKMGAEQIANIASSYMKAEKYQYAGEVFMEVDRLHRYSDTARKSLINASRAFHASGDYEMCRLAANRFIEDFPESRDADQAKYLIGLCYYEQIPDVSRDQRPAKEALREFTELIEKYPNSKLIPQAKEKFDEALTQIAGQEVVIGNFYLEKDQVLAALGRYKVVVDNYAMTPYVEEAIFRVFECYTLLGLTEKSVKYYRKLERSYPNSDWLEKAKNIKSF